MPTRVITFPLLAGLPQTSVGIAVLLENLKLALALSILRTFLRKADARWYIRNASGCIYIKKKDKKEKKENTSLRKALFTVVLGFLFLSLKKVLFIVVLSFLFLSSRKVLFIVVLSFLFLSLTRSFSLWFYSSCCQSNSLIEMRMKATNRQQTNQRANKQKRNE